MPPFKSVAQEREAIKQKALEQALRQAQLAKTCPEPLLPVIAEWPFSLTQDDRDFLKINKISPA